MTSPLDIRERCERSRELQGVVIWSIAKLTRPSSLRRQVAGDAATLAIELHGAIWVLIHSAHFAAAHALLRPMMETTARALWLLYAATFEQVEALASNRHTLDMGDLLRAMQKKRAFPQVDILCDLDEKSKKPIHSFTHGGFEALRRRADGFEPTEIIACLLIADLYLVIATDAVAVLHETSPLKPLMKEAAGRLGEEFTERFGTQVTEPDETKNGLPHLPTWQDPR